MAPALKRILGVPLLAVLWLFSLIGMSLAASLCAHYHVWAGSLGGWTKALLSLFVMTLFFSTVFILGLLFKPGDEVRPSPLANIPVNLAVFGFLWILGLICCIGIDVALDDNSCSRENCFLLGPACRRSRCSMFATMEAFAWMTWSFLSFYLIALGYSAFADRRETRAVYGGPAPLMAQAGGRA
ncbi:hypothetical protein BCR35DRAFT_300262 [Leucosporidium creatinivorum]|uniref:MARVEL domain-containing protein n=1 Tax=Leucosporidium creatinivorum TaxID=106004 RepID=A0A1Y2G413_9BASI|nr:hypothetical protein BCR35DRAFT_300262 [Leucosporidium creatinivorum]